MAIKLNNSLLKQTLSIITLTLHVNNRVLLSFTFYFTLLSYSHTNLIYSTIFIIC